MKRFIILFVAVASIGFISCSTNPPTTNPTISPAIDNTVNNAQATAPTTSKKVAPEKATPGKIAPVKK